VFVIQELLHQKSKKLPVEHKLYHLLGNAGTRDTVGTFWGKIRQLLELLVSPTLCICTVARYFRRTLHV